MSFFEEDHTEENKVKLKEFEEYYKDGIYHFLSVDSWEALYQYFMYEEGSNDYRKVKFIIYEALSQHQFSVFFTLRMAEVQCKANNFEQAMPYIELAKTLSPTDSDVSETAAQIFEHFKMYDKAIESFKEAYHMGASKFDILFQMGLCYLNANEKRKALKTFRRLAILQPKNEFVLDHIAMLVFDNEWYKEGIAIYEKVIDETPYSETAWHYYGNAFAGIENFDKAIWAQEMVIAINPKNYLGHFGIASTFQEMEEYEKATEKYNQIIKDFDGDSLIYTNLGFCNEKLERYESARAHYRKAISFDLQTSAAWYGIGMTLLTEKRTKESIYFFNNAYKYGKNEDSHFGLSLATAYLLNKESALAEGIYEKLVSVFPDDYEVWIDYSSLYSCSNNYLRAIETLETALFYLPSDHRIQYRLAGLHLKLNEIKKGSDYLEKALNNNYKDHNLLYLFDSSFQKDKSIQSLIKLYKNK